jgi:hypothetical protein
MTFEQAVQHVNVSRRVIARWETMGTPTGSKSDFMSAIAAELLALQKLADQFAVLALEAARLAERYQTVSRRLKVGMN